MIYNLQSIKKRLVSSVIWYVHFVSFPIFFIIRLSVVMNVNFRYMAIVDECSPFWPFLSV